MDQSEVTMQLELTIFNELYGKRLTGSMGPGSKVQEELKERKNICKKSDSGGSYLYYLPRWGRCRNLCLGHM